MMRHQKITIINIRRPRRKSLNEELKWFGNSLGLLSIRDKDSSCFRMFIELLKAAKVGQPLSSDDLAIRLSLSRGTVVHHLHKLQESGLVITQRHRYMLRDANLQAIIEDLRKDMTRMLEDLERTAAEIDSVLGL